MENRECECKHERPKTCEELCDSNPRHEQFDRVVAAWQTIRHFDVRSHDTVRPICTDGLKGESLEKCVSDKCK